MEKNYYLISYGYHYSSSNSADHVTTVINKEPIDFIKEKIKDGQNRNTTPLYGFHILYVEKINLSDYNNWDK